MFTQPKAQVIRWQDLKVKSEVDIVFDLAQQKGWEDCEIFGYGDMITQPLESKDWKLIPADLYEYSIPPEAVERVLQILNAGVCIQGVIIADDERRNEPQPTRARIKDLLASAKPVASWIGKALLLLLKVAGLIILLPFFLIGSILDSAPTGVDVEYDPKLIILIDDEKGGTVWVSIFTWFE